MKYKTYRLGDVVNIFDKRRVPLSSMQRAERQGEYRYFGAQGVIDYVDDYIFEGIYLLIAEDGENLKSKKQNVAQIVSGKFWVNNHAHILQAKEKHNIYYLGYLINSMDLSGYITGSAQPKLSQTNLNAIELELPDKSTQDKIASVLQAFDNKIDLNNEINKNLMEQARILLRIYISNSEDLQFITLGEVAEINKGTYSPKEKWPFINYLDTSSVTDGVVSELQYLDTASDKVPSRARRELQKNDIVFSTVRPNQRHFGIITEPVSNMLASTGFAVIRSNVAGISNELLYLCLTENMFIEQMQQIAEQSTSTFPSIKPSDLESCKIPSFSSDQSEELNFALASIFSLYSMHQLENNSLSQLRDTLLPKLMSGEIDISDIDL